MKILNYALIAALAILAILLFQQCSQHKKQVVQLNEKIDVLGTHNQQLTEAFLIVKNKLDSCSISPAKEIIKTKVIYQKSRDTIFIDRSDTTLVYQPIPETKIDVITSYHLDSLYKSVSGIEYKGELLSFNQYLTINKPVLLPTIPGRVDRIEYVEVIKPLSVRYPRLFLTASVSFDKIEPTNYNVGLGLMDNKFNFYQIQKSINCDNCFNIGYSMPFIYSRR